MSNRRKPRQQQRRHQQSPAATAKDPLAGMEPWLWAMLDADEAERRGDAAGAIAAMQRRPLAPDGSVFWRPSRGYRLAQLALLGPDVPRWAVSRWILEQALQHLSERDQGRSTRTRTGRALRVVTDLRGLPALGAATIGGDVSDSGAQSIDHDWVYRQVHLFELGGLDAFLGDGASSDLIAGADRIREWALAPMGGYTFLGSGGATLLWLDKESREVVTTPNIGSAVHLVPGCSVIGRLVPAGDGVMFESAPLGVPGVLALAVAADPALWLDRLRDSGQVKNGTIQTGVLEWTGLVSDVPIDLVCVALEWRPDEQQFSTRDQAADYARAALCLVREAVEDLSTNSCPCCEWESDGVGAEGLDGPDSNRDEWDGWAYLHAVLLDPNVIEALPGVITHEDEPLLREVCELLAEPASSWVSRLLDASRNAA